MSSSSVVNWSGYVKLLNEFNNNIEAAMCNRCKYIMQFFDNASLQNHKERCKGITIQKCITDNEEKDDEYLHSATNADSDQMDDETMEIMKESDFTKKGINKLLTKLFVSCNIPFKTVQTKEFHDFVTALCSIHYQYKLPCRESLASSFINNLHKEICEKRKTMFSGTSSVLLVDGWRNKSSNRKLLVFTLRNMNIPQTFLTYFDVSIDQETGENLSNLINEAIKIAKEEYNTNVYAIVSDNDSKILCGGRLSKTSDNTSLWQSSCSSHSGNLLLKSLVDSDLEEKVRIVVQAFRDPKLEELLRRQKGTKLRNYPDTRFGYFRDSCRIILKNLEILQRLSLINDVKIYENVFNIIHDEKFKTDLKNVVHKFNPICKLINNCQSPNCNIADSTEMWLSLNLESNVELTILKERLQKAIYPVGYAANWLHPEYRGRLLNDAQKEIAYNFLCSQLQNEDELIKFLDHDKNSEIHRLIDKCKNPVSFWSLCDVFFPNLANVAMKLMIIPGSTAQLEGLFSNWTYIHNQYRNRLSPSTSSKLVDIYYSIKRKQSYNSFPNVSIDLSDDLSTTWTTGESSDSDLDDGDYNCDLMEM